MSHKGAPWLHEHDVLLLDNIDKSNTELAEMLGRSAWAVECRRRALEVELKMSNPSMTLDECIVQYKADPLWGKRRAEEPVQHARKRVRPLRRHGTNTSSGVTSAAESVQKASSDVSVIAAAAESIRLNQGSMAEAWNNPDFTPFLIKHYDGFSAFSAAMAAKRVSPVDLPQASGIGHAEFAVAKSDEHGVSAEAEARVA